MKSRIMYISAKFWNWHFKQNILGKMIVLRNRCINLCPEKCNLGQIPICCQEMCSEQLKCFPVSSSTRSLGSWNSNFSQMSIFFAKYCFQNFTYSSLFVVESRDPQRVLVKAYWRYLSGKVLKKRPWDTNSLDRCG